ncbi:zonular occludens toxin domain-containing protein [Escherichia coli]|uniref:zonular occludens toxin domain-containing protein n=1 Tax=Escherichia coli TaxID=562 RepID=UPI00202B4FF4|nr:zonular occludens toxin domain-containing protein [Escherichia coli]
MAISAYVGVPGHGKSYEVVGSVILPAYLAGRRIVTNIDGVKESNFYEYAKRHNKDLNSLGTIINCTNDDVLSPQFLPYKDAEEETFCKSGDLIAIDEAWRFWIVTRIFAKNIRRFSLNIVICQIKILWRHAILLSLTRALTR